MSSAGFLVFADPDPPPVGHSYEELKATHPILRDLAELESAVAQRQDVPDSQFESIHKRARSFMFMAMFDDFAPDAVWELRAINYGLVRASAMLDARGTTETHRLYSQLWWLMHQFGQRVYDRKRREVT